MRWYTSSKKDVYAAQFTDPHSQMDAKGPYTKEELIRALRQDIAAEEEATSLYDSHAAMCDDEKIKQVIMEIADEERVHIGELHELICRLAEDEKDLFQEGRDEVVDAIGESQ